jgi:hypothetical protein
MFQMLQNFITFIVKIIDFKFDPQHESLVHNSKQQQYLGGKSNNIMGYCILPGPQVGWLLLDPNNFWSHHMHNE